MKKIFHLKLNQAISMKSLEWSTTFLVTKQEHLPKILWNLRNFLLVTNHMVKRTPRKFSTKKELQMLTLRMKILISNGMTLCLKTIRSWKILSVYSRSVTQLLLKRKMMKSFTMLRLLMSWLLWMRLGILGMSSLIETKITISWLKTKWAT